MRNEQIICDACKKTWDRVQGGMYMNWEHQVELKFVDSGGMGVEENRELVAEVCSECSSKALRVLAAVRDFLSGEPLAYEAMTAILEVL